MLDWLATLPDKRVPGVPGVLAQKSATLSGTPTQIAGVPGVLEHPPEHLGTPCGTPECTPKLLNNNEEHREHREHCEIDDATLRRGLAQWHKGLASIDPYTAPAGIGEGRWREIHADAMILFNEWAARAARLGWRGLDLFGVEAEALGNLGADPDAPHGLAWRLRGRRVQRIFDGGASFALRAGQAGKFYRGDPASRVLLWSLK